MDIHFTLTSEQYTYTINALEMRIQRCKDNRWIDEEMELQTVLVGIEEAWKRVNNRVEIKEL